MAVMRDEDLDAPLGNATISDDHIKTIAGSSSLSQTTIADQTLTTNGDNLSFQQS